MVRVKSDRALARLLLLAAVYLPGSWLQIAAAEQPQAVEVGITTHLGDRQQFVDGDVLSFLLSLDRGAWIYLFYRDAGGNLLQLLPNQRLPQHFFSAGLFMPVPNENLPFRYEVAPPYGDESIFVFASDSSDLSFAGTPLDNGLILLEQEITAVGERIESNSLKFFGRAELSISTRAAQQ